MIPPARWPEYHVTLVWPCEATQPLVGVRVYLTRVTPDTVPTDLQGSLHQTTDVHEALDAALINYFGPRGITHST